MRRSSGAEDGGHVGTERAWPGAGYGAGTGVVGCGPHRLRTAAARRCCPPAFRERCGSDSRRARRRDRARFSGRCRAQALIRAGRPAMVPQLVPAGWLVFSRTRIRAVRQAGLTALPAATPPPTGLHTRGIGREPGGQRKTRRLFGPLLSGEFIPFTRPCKHESRRAARRGGRQAAGRVFTLRHRACAGSRRSRLAASGRCRAAPGRWRAVPCPAGTGPVPVAGRAQ